MKKTLVLMLTTVLTLSLTACGGGGASSAGGNASEPEEEKMVIPGNYMSVGMVPGDTYILHENGSYDYGEEKGTYTADEDGETIDIQPKDGTPRALDACGIYYHTAAKMTEDTEYGLAPSFDENGHSNQTFTTIVDNVTLTLELKEDGNYTFSYSQASPVHDKLTDIVSYAGTYALKDTVLNLDWNGNTFPFLVEDDVIYPVVYEKETDKNSTSIQTMQNAIQTAADEAAQSRWWTPADEATTAAVTQALIGTWDKADAYSLYRFVFTDTGVSVRMEFMGRAVLTSSGTFTIHNRAILLEYKSQSGQYTIINHKALPYTFVDGNLVVYDMLDVMNDEVLRDPAVDFPAVSEAQYQKTA